MTPEQDSPARCLVKKQDPPERYLVQKSGRWAWRLASSQAKSQASRAWIKVKGGRKYPLVLCLAFDERIGAQIVLWRCRLRKDGVYECFNTRGGRPRPTFSADDLALARPVRAHGLSRSRHPVLTVASYRETDSRRVERRLACLTA